MRAPGLPLVARRDIAAEHTPGHRFSAWAPFLIAVLVTLAALAGIMEPAIYGRETASWAAQGVGQDWVNLLVAVPALSLLGGVALGGARWARLIVGGILLYTAYSYAIYAFAVHFNALFLVYCAVLGASSFALVDLVATLRADNPERWFSDRAPLRIAAATLFAIAGVFGALWLAQDVPALMRGAPPADLTATGLVSNPVHVLDLSLVLPALVVTGVSLLRRQRLGNVLGPILLAFGVLMALAIGGMVLAMNLRGVAIDVMPTVAMAIVAAGSLAVLVSLLRHMR